MTKRLVHIVGLFFFGCNNPCIEMGDPASTKHEVVVYNITPADSVYWSHDLVITNYKNDEQTAKDFYEIAKQYKDTCKTNIPIASIFFYGQKVGGCVPDLTQTTRGLDKISIIDFSFEKNNQNEVGKENLKLIIIWKNGEFESFYRSLNEKKFDSILYSKAPLNLGIN